MKNISGGYIKNFIPIFLNSITVKNNSKNTYSRSLHQFIHYIDLNDSSSINTCSISNYIKHLQNNNLSDFTISNYITILKKFFSWCCSENICEDFSKNINFKTKITGFRKKALKISDISNLLDSIKRDSIADYRNYALINLMVRTGLRVVEISRANHSDIKPGYDSKLLYIHGKGRSGKDEFVILTPDCYAPLNDFFEKISNEGFCINENTPIFPSFARKNYFEKMSTRSISRIIKNAFNNIGLNTKEYSAHSLRHTAVTFCLLGGGSVQEAQILARHCNINTTMIYAQNINRIKDAPEKYIDNLLKNIQ